MENRNRLNGARGQGSEGEGSGLVFGKLLQLRHNLGAQAGIQVVGQEAFDDFFTREHSRFLALAPLPGAQVPGQLLAEHQARPEQDRPGLLGQELRLWGPRPVRHEESRPARYAAIGEEGRELGVDGDLAVGSLPAPFDQGRVGGDAVDPASQRGSAFECVDLAEDGQEDVLNRLLRVGFVAGDPVR